MENKEKFRSLSIIKPLNVARSRNKFGMTDSHSTRSLSDPSPTQGRGSNNYSTVQPFNCSTKLKRCAFTLAEILITLGIIGVVAAMTMPTLIKKHQEMVTVSKVKKFYSTMNQAYLMSVKDNDYPNYWNVSNGTNSTTATQLASYFKPYLKIAKDCGTGSGCLKYTQNVKSLNGNPYTQNYDTNNMYYKLILNDGSYIWLRGTNPYCRQSEGGHSNVCAAVWTDVNGHKEPNTIGKDIFLLLITTTGVKTRTTTTNCNINSDGWPCLTYILLYGKMDYLYK